MRNWRSSELTRPTLLSPRPHSRCGVVYESTLACKIDGLCWGSNDRTSDQLITIYFDSPEQASRFTERCARSVFASVAEEYRAWPPPFGSVAQLGEHGLRVAREECLFAELRWKLSLGADDDVEVTTRQPIEKIGWALYLRCGILCTASRVIRGHTQRTTSTANRVITRLVRTPNSISTRSLSVLFIAGVSSSLLGCGGDEQEPPSGPHSTYVINSVTLPASTDQANELAFDLDDNGTKDNQLGRLVVTLMSQSFMAQATLDGALKSGSFILLVDFQAPSFASAAGAGFEVKIGKDPMPAACTNPDDPATCGKHLDGNGSFAVSTMATASGKVVGPITSGTFDGGPGELAFALAVGGALIDFQLIGARVEASGISEAGIATSQIGGAISKTDIDNKLIPAVHTQLVQVIDSACPGNTPPDCGCAAGSASKSLMGLLDTNPKDCNVTLEEVQGNDLLTQLLRPDVKIDGVDAVSFGLSGTAVKATIR
jgi:hypothetical protein